MLADDTEDAVFDEPAGDEQGKETAEQENTVIKCRIRLAQDIHGDKSADRQDCFPLIGCNIQFFPFFLFRTIRFFKAV